MTQENRRDENGIGSRRKGHAVALCCIEEAATQAIRRREADRARVESRKQPTGRAKARLARPAIDSRRSFGERRRTPLWRVLRWLLAGFHTWPRLIRGRWNATQPSCKTATPMLRRKLPCFQLPPTPSHRPKPRHSSIAAERLTARSKFGCVVCVDNHSLGV
jgi:hypothetical protein